MGWRVVTELNPYSSCRRCNSSAAAAGLSASRKKRGVEQLRDGQPMAGGANAHRGPCGGRHPARRLAAARPSDSLARGPRGRANLSLPS